MNTSFSWTCPTCGSHTVITDPNHKSGYSLIKCDNTASGQHVRLTYWLTECPNTACKTQSFSVKAEHGQMHYSNGTYIFRNPIPAGIGDFTFLPTTSKPLSKHAPNHVAEDYSEAYLIRTLSPKASATLARRALQGMVRDFFTIKGKRTLHDELLAIKDDCDPALHSALMAVKSIGNIGAHPEQDINLMVDVEPGEAETLLQLIHLLDQEWYIQRAAREERLRKIKILAEDKEAARTPQPPK